MRRTNDVRLLAAACAVTLASLLPTTALALYEAPANYYKVTNETGEALRTRLRLDMSAGHVLPTFNQLRDYLPFIDANPTNPNEMLLVYTREKVVNPSGSRTIGFHGTYQSREHTWPDSRLSDSLDPEPFFIRASDTGSGSANGDRSNYYFGGANLTGAARVINPTATLADRRFFAGDVDKGDVARGMFYGATRYSNLTLNNTATPNPSEDNVMGDLSTLLRWHYQDAPDLFERRRNDVIYSGDDAATANSDDSAFAGTNNRNAFIDHPEYVWTIFAKDDNGNALVNDTKLSFGTANADGSSTTTVNLGRVLRGAAVPAGQTITLAKAGTAGTYYSVTAGGSATSTVGGRFNAFTMDTAGSQAITVGLDTTTTTAGLKSGTVTVDNLDVSTLGAGTGGNDGNDVANLSLSVLDSSNSSFSATTDTNSLAIDFGSVGQGTTVGTRAFSIFDFASTLGAALTASLDLDSITPGGASSKLTTNLAQFANLLAGNGNTFAASFDTSTLGQFMATYTLGLSDENIAGTQTTSSLVLTLTGTVVAVPEPASLAMLLLAVAPIAMRRRRHA